MKAIWGLAAALALVAVEAQAADYPPPTGDVIYSLTGQTMSGSYSIGTATFVAGSTTTDLAFAFREDPAYILLSNVSMTNLTDPNGNLVTNGDFNAGTYFVANSGGSQPDGWTYLNLYNAVAAGRVVGGCGVGGNNCYDDGSVGSYDAISQEIATVVGDTYQVSFYYLDTDPNSTYEPTGDGTGRDMFVYAGNGVPVAAVPEPASLALLATGLLGLGIRRRRLRR